MLKKFTKPISAYDRYFREADEKEDQVSITVAPRKNRGTDYSEDNDESGTNDTTNISVPPRSNRGTDYTQDSDETGDTNTGSEDTTQSPADDGATNYTADNNDETTTGDNPPSINNNNDNDNAENNEDDTSDEAGDGDDSSDNEPDTGDDEDYTQSDDNSSDDSGEEDTNSTPQETDEEKDEKHKKYHMYKRYIHLYNTIDSMYEKIRDIVKNSATENAVIKTVTNNISDIYNNMYDYMTIKYKSESYVQVLIYFETIVSLMCLNFELLRNNHINLKQ